MATKKWNMWNLAVCYFASTSCFCKTFIFAYLPPPTMRILDIKWSLLQPRLCSRACMLILLATIRGAYTWLEQPCTSSMRYFPDLVAVGEAIKKHLNMWGERTLSGPQSNWNKWGCHLFVVSNIIACSVSWDLGEPWLWSHPEHGAPGRSPSVLRVKDYRVFLKYCFDWLSPCLPCLKTKISKKRRIQLALNSKKLKVTIKKTKCDGSTSVFNP